MSALFCWVGKQTRQKQSQLYGWQQAQGLSQGFTAGKNVAKGSEHAHEMKAVSAEDPKGGFFLLIGLERLWVLDSSLLWQGMAPDFHWGPAALMLQRCDHV